MYSSEFLKSFGLEIWQAPGQVQNAQQMITPQETAEAIAKPSGQKNLDLSPPMENKPPRDCFNCEHSGQSDWCSLKESKIDDLDAETDCPDFSIGIHCGHCGEYEDGLCHFKGIQKPKNPGDECEYDIRCFM